MRIATTLIASTLLLAACGPRDGEDTDDKAELDQELVDQIMTQYEVYNDVNVMLEETVEDANGNIVPKWYNTHFFEYQRDTLAGMGIHVIDISYDITSYEEERARILQYEYDEQGRYSLVALEWYFEPLEGEEPEETPTLFGLPMDGIMGPHIPGQSEHYDIHGFFWTPHEDLAHTYFGEFNPGLIPVDWWLEAEPTMLESFGMNDPNVRQNAGYTEAGDCITTAEGDAGIPVVNSALVGQLDPMGWDTLLTTPDGALLGIQWTAPVADHAEPPVLFGQTFTEEGDNYVLRMWQGITTNPGGLFEPYLPQFACPM